MEIKESQVHKIQRLLEAKGYYTNGVDGVWGNGSAKALSDFLKAENFKENPNGNLYHVLGTEAIMKKLEAKEADFITNAFLKPNEVYREVAKKNKITLHHTAGGGNAYSVRDWWNMSTERVGTDFVIGSDGTVLRVIPKGYWAWHLGVGRWELDSQSIGIEICNYGFLTRLADGTFLNAYGGNVIPSEVCELEKPFKGFKYFQKYTDKQIESLKKLVEYLSLEYNIPLSSFDDSFEINAKAFDSKTAGIFTHNSYLSDKTDIYPDKRILSYFQNHKPKKQDEKSSKKEIGG